MLRPLVVLCFCLGFLSCKKDGLSDYQIDSIMIGSHFDIVSGEYKEGIQNYKLWKDIKYDDQGRLSLFGPEHFEYAADGKVVETSMMASTSNLWMYYAIDYDSQKRVSEY